MAVTLREAGDMGEEKNINRLKKEIGIKQLFQSEQVHDSSIAVVGNDSPLLSKGCDGLITFEKEIFLGIRIADCYPVYLYGESFIGLLHSGFRPVKMEILEKAVSLLNEKGIAVQSVKALVGPGVCPKHYWIDLKKIIIARLKKLGVRDIRDTGLHSCEGDSFFSYRKEGKNAGRNLALIAQISAFK